MDLRLVKGTGKKLEFKKGYKEKIDNLFRMPEKLRAKLYEDITFTEILSIPFKNSLNKKSIKLEQNQKNMLSRAGYHDLIIDYLTLSALTDNEKRYLFDDLNHGKVPFFLKFQKVARSLKHLKTPLTPFTTQEVVVKYVNIEGERLKQEHVTNSKICLNVKGLSLLAKTCPNLRLFNPVLIN